MTKHRMEKLAEACADAVRGFVAEAERRIMSAVGKRFEELPQPRDGRDGADASPEAIKAAAEQAVAALGLRDGEDGKPGKDAEPVDVKAVAAECMPVLKEHVDQLVAAIPPAEKGEPGEKGADGKDAEPPPLEAIVEAALPHLKSEIAEAVKALPPAERGEKGDTGDKGDPGEPGQGVELDDLLKAYLPEVERMVEAAAKALPPAERGEKGDRGDAGADADPQAVADLLLPKLGEIALQAVAEIPKPANGQDGKSADPADVALLLLPDMEKRFSEAVAALPVPKDGRDGEPGPRGEDGKSVEPEVLREMVQAAVDEIPRPKDGRDGLKGEPGRDALQIDILPALDEKRVYPRSTFAQHKGGLWRSHKTTDGLIGWDCIVRGIDSLSIEQDPEDPRKFLLSVHLSDGAEERRELYIPAVVDKGLYKEGVAYRKGDGVTWARHYWIASVDTKSKPDFGDDWRLAVKSGRDGKQGEPGERGPRGPKGEDGRNMNIGGMP